MCIHGCGLILIFTFINNSVTDSQLGVKYFKAWINM